MATLLRTNADHHAACGVLCCAVKKEDMSQMVSIQYMLWCYRFMDLKQAKTKSHNVA